MNELRVKSKLPYFQPLVLRMLGFVSFSIAKEHADHYD